MVSRDRDESRKSSGKCQTSSKNVSVPSTQKVLLGLQDKGLRFAVEEGVVIQAAAKVAGGGPKPRGWRKLNFSEGTWQAHGKVPAKKCDARYGRKFLLARWRRIWKRSASTSIRRTRSAKHRARFSPSSRAMGTGTAVRKWLRRSKRLVRTGLA